MKTISKITIGLATAALLFVGCSDAGEAAAPAGEAKVIQFQSEESLGLRKTDLYSEASDTVGHEAKYSTQAATTSTKIKRAFQDAPPMIPHDVEGMLPITIKDNQCTGCHMPDVAPSVGATAIPVSHLTNFRPVHNLNGQDFSKSIDNMKNEVAINDNKGKLVGARYNCSQCHAPQSGVDLAVGNTFEADFTSADGASKSSWDSSKFMKGIDTINGK